jgi:hypothetical protein
LPSIAPTVLADKLLHGSGHRGWARRLETPAPGRLRCQQEDPSGGHRPPWGAPLQTSDTSGPLRGSNPSVCHVSGPRGHRGNSRTSCGPGRGVRASGPRVHRGNQVQRGPDRLLQRPAHAGTGATTSLAAVIGAIVSGPRGHRGNYRVDSLPRRAFSPAHAGTGATTSSTAPPPAGGCPLLPGSCQRCLRSAPCTPELGNGALLPGGSRSLPGAPNPSDSLSCHNDVAAGSWMGRLTPIEP